MPYLRCNGCGVVSYAPVNGAGAVCPECGVPWPIAADEVVHSTDPDRRLDALVRMTRDLLDADVALLNEIGEGYETVRMIAGEWPQLTPGSAAPLEETFCSRMLQGRIGNVIGDAAHDEDVADLGHAFGVGAWMGVPVQVSDAELYVLCCLAREARPSVGAREVKLLTGLAESVRVELQSRGALRR